MPKRFDLWIIDQETEQVLCSIPRLKYRKARKLAKLWRSFSLPGFSVSVCRSRKRFVPQQPCVPDSRFALASGRVRS